MGKAEPNSGELLAVANWPTFNPNAAKDSPPDARVADPSAARMKPSLVLGPHSSILAPF